jgi:hypothetical protein
MEKERLFSLAAMIFKKRLAIAIRLSVSEEVNSDIVLLLRDSPSGPGGITRSDDSDHYRIRVPKEEIQRLGDGMPHDASDHQLWKRRYSISAERNTHSAGDDPPSRSAQIAVK